MAMRRLLGVCGGLALALSLRAGTIVLYDSTEQASTGVDSIADLGPLYDSFSTGASSGALSYLGLLVGIPPTSGGGSASSFTVGLYADNDTAPGPLITDLGTVSDSSLTGSVSLIDVVLTADPVLSSDTRYWIGLSGTTAAYWAWTIDTSGPGVNGEYYADVEGTFPTNPFGGYQIEVEINSTPEPSTLFLGASALALVLLRRGRLEARLRTMHR